MAIQTYSRLYSTYGDAADVVRSLEASGVPHSDISIVGPEPTKGTDTPATTDTTDTHAGNGAGTGATLGTILGGGAGLLAGIGSLAIPGVGPVVAAGWLIATLTGAGVGAAALGLAGSLVGSGVSHDEAHVYAEGVRRGGTLVSVRADETRRAEIEGMFAQHPSKDYQSANDEYRAGGWAPENDIGTSTTAPLPGDDLSGTRTPGSTVI